VDDEAVTVSDPREAPQHSLEHDMSLHESEVQIEIGAASKANAGGQFKMPNELQSHS